MKPETARWIFYTGTALSLLLFLGLTADTHRQIKTLTHEERLTESVVAGKKVWHKYNCNDCHTILGFGSYYGPDLTAVYPRRGAVRIRTAVMTPESVTTWRKMPRLHLSEAEVASLVSFFEWTGNIDTHDWPPQDRSARARAARRLQGGRLPPVTPAPLGAHAAPEPRATPTSPPADASRVAAATPARPPRIVAGAGTDPGTSADADSENGHELFRESDCYDCHKLGQVGGDDGPDLSDVGLRLTPARIDSVLADPTAVDPEAEMPQPELTRTERAELVRYLSGLREPREEKR